MRNTDLSPRSCAGLALAAATIVFGAAAVADEPNRGPAPFESLRFRSIGPADRKSVV